MLLVQSQSSLSDFVLVAFETPDLMGDDGIPIGYAAFCEWFVDYPVAFFFRIPRLSSLPRYFGFPAS